MLLLCAGMNVLLAQINAPTLSSPSNGATLSSAVDVTFSWSSVTGAGHYILVWDTVPSFDSPAFRTSTTTSTSRTFDMKFGTKYYWRVCATNTNNTDTSAWSAVRNFTTCSTVTLSSPSNGSTLSSAVDVTFSWSSITGAGHYILAWDTVPSFDSPAFRTSTTTSTSRTFDMKFGTKYYWRVCATNYYDTDTSAWSAVRNFTTTYAPTLSSPSDGTVYSSTIKPTLSWNTITGASQYIYQCDTTPTFDSPLAETNTTTSTSVDKLRLRFNTTYYWRVCATNYYNTDTSAWSVMRHFTTCGAPILNSPNDGIVYSSVIMPSVSWNSITGVGHYILEWDTVSTFDSPLSRTFSTTSTSVSISALKFGTTYYWRVCATNNNDSDTSAWSTVRTFTTCDAPTLSSPSDGSTLSTVTPTTYYNTITGAGGYLMQWSEDPDFATHEEFSLGSSGNGLTLTRLKFSTTYYWRVCAINNNSTDTSAWSEVWSFTTTDGVPVLTSPADGTAFSSYSNSRLTVYWNSVTGADHYILEWDTAATFNSPLFATFTASGASVYITEAELQYGTTYYWRVCAINSNAPDTSSWSTVWRFTTPYQLTTGPTLISPANDSSDIDFQSVLALQWNTLANVNGYRYQVSTSSDFSTLFAQGTTAQTTASIHNLRPATTYYWRVQGYNGVGNSVWSAVWHFTTGGCPPISSSLSLEVCENDLPYHYVNGDIDTTFEVGTPQLSTFNFQLLTPLGCDSTVTLHLTVHPAVTSTSSVTVCENDLPYHYVDGEIDTTFEVGTPNLSIFSFQFSTQHGCDSTVILTVNIKQPVENETYMTACDEYEWNGEVLTASGDYTATFTAANGCDSTVTLHLTINEPTESDTTATACGSFNWHGYTNLTESGDYTDVLTNAAGCDSTVTLHLTINVPTEGDTTAMACGSFNWHGYTNLTESGDYTDVLENAAGCDSIVTLHLTVNQPVVTEPVEVTICENDLPYHYVNGAIDTTFEVGTPNLSTITYNLTTGYGCDSTVILTVNIATATESDTTATACGSFNWHGYTNLTESGDYTDVLTNVAGCDSVVTLHLTINVPTESDTTAMACGSFNWHGYTNLTESGDYTDVLTNAAGCDSTVTLHLTINPLPEVTISGETSFCEGGSTILTASGAETYEWSTMEFGAEFEVAEAGTYTVIGTDANGCTSTASIEVTENTINTEVYFVEVGDGFLEALQGDAEYQWMDCSTHEPIEGATQQQFAPEVSGSYACVITLGECTDTTECVDFSVGVEEWNDDNITLYPNPTTGMVNVQFIMNNEQWENAEIQVFDVYGRLLQTVETCHGASLQTTQIDLSRYTTGIYLLRVINGGKVMAVRKVVKR